MAVVGPGTIQEQSTDRSSTLDGASEFEYVTILNPLTDDFAILVAQDVPVNVPFQATLKDQTVDESQLSTIYGANLRNPDFKGRRHIQNQTIIKSGQTINLKGNEAQVAVRQLVNEILQREGKTRLMTDPILRKEVEDRIIISRGSVQELMDTNLTSTSQQATVAVNKSNEVSDEEPFPGLEPTTGFDATGIGSPASPDSTSVKRSPGRPKKA